MPGSPTHLLLVEDHAAQRQLLAEQLTRRGYRVHQVASGEEALTQLADFAFDLLITDLRLPGIDGTAVVAAAMARYPDIITIIVTGYGTMPAAVRAVKQGAWDILAKPFDIEELLRVIGHAIDNRPIRPTERQVPRPDDHAGVDALVGPSPAIRRLRQLIETIAPASSTVLISGETGTGKEVVARAIHQGGPRREHRFVVLNCSAIPDTLQEAELFGHVRGAFTGAVEDRPGRLLQAHKGTLFLDEVGTMSPGLQMKLLRVLQEREFERLGESRTIKVDVRVIAATNNDLAELVSEGRFREDLYYRLHVIPVELPPLRRRAEDIPLLAARFLSHEAQRSGSPAPAALSQAAIRRMAAYRWPGNVRELENVLARAIAFGGGKPEIDVDDLPPELTSIPKPALSASITLPEDGVDLNLVVAEVERELIQRSLERTGGNKEQAARLLRLKRTTLVEKLKRFNRG